MNRTALPRHHRSGLLALGFRKDGRPIWPIAGAEDDSGGDGKPDDDKGDKGGEFKPPQTQADFDRIIGERVARERQKYGDYEDLKKVKAERDAELEKAKDEHTKALDAARNEGKTEATKAGNNRLIRAEIRAAAAELRFRDPTDAHRYLDDIGTIKVTDDGDVDAAEVKRRLDELAKTKDYLLKGEEKPGKPKADKSQGGNPGSQTAGVSAGRDMFSQSRNRKSNSTKE